MKRYYGYVSMGLGLALLCAAVGLCWRNRAEEYEAAQAAAYINDIFASEIYTIPTDAVPKTDVEQTVTIDGYAYIGEVNIPSLDLSLPIMAQWSYEGMRIAPGRYAGSVLENDLIIAGHNYSSHFGPLKELKTGDAVQFTDVLGQVYDYTVCDTEIIDGHDAAAMLQGDWDMTLFTCTYGGASRVTIRCRRTEEWH